MPRIHPTATVDGSAKLADDVVIGPYCVVEADVEIGPGTELLSHVVVRRFTTLGEGNRVDPFCVFGGLPQDLHFDPATETHLRIGDHNVFRESVTISRATKPGGATVVGSHTYWMVNSHAGHDTTIEDRAVLVNCVAIGGHATVHQRAILSGNSHVHQFVWIGEMAITQGLTGVAMHVPPYTMVANISNLIGLNRVGLQRAPDITEEDRRQIKEAYRATYRSGRTPAEALAEMDRWTDMTPAAAKFREFVRKVIHAEGRYKRGLCAPRDKRRH